MILCNVVAKQEQEGGDLEGTGDNISHTVPKKKKKDKCGSGAMVVEGFCSITREIKEYTLQPVLATLGCRRLPTGANGGGSKGLGISDLGDPARRDVIIGNDGERKAR